MEKKRKNTRGDNGQGTMRRKTRNCWEWSMMTGRNPETGKRTYKYLYAPTVYELREMRDEYLRDRKDGITDEDCAFTQWGEIWFNHHALRKKPATQECYKYTLKLLNQTGLGAMSLKKITLFDIEDALRYVYDNYSGSAYSKCRGTLYMMFDTAVAMNKIRMNVMRSVEKLEVKHGEPKKAFSQTEIQRLLDKLKMDKVGLSIIAMILSGVRRQEMLAWDISKGDLAADGSYIQVRQAVAMDHGRAFISETKNANSVRVVPIPKDYRHYIVKLRSCAEGLLWESPKKKGCPINPRTFDDYFKAALEEVGGVRVLTPHCCRHTFVTQLQSAGVDLPTISALTGHAELESTLNYLHVRDEAKARAMEVYAASLRPLAVAV